VQFPMNTSVIIQHAKKLWNFMCKRKLLSCRGQQDCYNLVAISPFSFTYVVDGHTFLLISYVTLGSKVWSQLSGRCIEVDTMQSSPNKFEDSQQAYSVQWKPFPYITSVWKEEACSLGNRNFVQNR
jgi:hypothetical protein